MTFKELQQEFQLARTTAYDLVRRKDFPAIKDTSGTWIINEKKLITWLKKNTKGKDLNQHGKQR